MGIRGLLSYCLANKAQCVTQIDLVEEARKRKGIQILVDFYSFEHLILQNFWKSLSQVANNEYIRLYGGEYGLLGAYITKLIKDLRSLDIELVMVIDASKGSSKSATQQKLETWKQRHENDIKKLETLIDVCKGRARMCDIPDSTAVRPVLLEVQLHESLRQCGVEIIQSTTGEADFILARELQQRPKALAILSNDSDFCILKNSVFIPNELFDINKDLQLGENQPYTEKPIRLFVGVITPKQVMASLGFLDHGMLVELAIIGGNDFTGHFMRGRLRGKLGIRGKGMIQDIAVWVKQYKNSQNHPVIAKEMECNPEFAAAVYQSRQFYDLSIVDEEFFSKGDITTHIKEGVKNGDFPASFVGMHNNFYWHRMLLEDPAYGYPCSEVAMTELRGYIYRMLLPRNEHVVVENGRTPWQIFKTSGVHASRDHSVRLPAVHYVKKDNIFQSLRLLHRITTHQEPGFQVDYFQRYGRKNGFTCLCLRYFLIQNYGHNLQIAEDEFFALVCMVFRKVNEPWYHCLQFRPTPRCITIGNWFQNIYRHAYLFLGKMLYLTHEFPTPAEVFSGAVWTAFYFAIQPSGYPGAPPDVLPQARRDMDVVLEEKKHMIRYIVQDIYEFSDR